MRILVHLIIVLVIGLLVGGLTSQYSIRASHGLGAINVGPWSAWPFVGGAEIDPYTAARATADGTLPLGAAEGLAFEATRDGGGSELNRKCQYVLKGNTPTAKLWTIAAYTDQGELISGPEGSQTALMSRNIVRFPDSSFLINLSDEPTSGNWMPLSGDGSFRLILRLYDTPITSSSGLIDPSMPSIKLLGCGS
jgi:hypothetical protein